MEGYPRISERLAQNRELGIYRRFAALQAQDLLYRQAELHNLEADLRQYAEEDANAEKVSGKSEASRYSRNWHNLANDPSGNRRQWNTFCTLREKLKEYNEVLLRQALISQHYRSPKAHDLDNLNTYLAHPEFYLLGMDSRIWEEEKLAHDLVTLKADGSDDGFTEWIARHVIKPFHQLIGQHFMKPSEDIAGMANYSDQAITRFAVLVATVISSVFPIVGVIILYFVRDLLARIGIIAGLTALFSLSLALVTDARRGEIFGATAAFSAVLVVFLGAGGAS